ncbi:hypothetical protein WN55_07004 [Dufourea novaeangliae]|uniref:Uncharacterized protein n=1 Tax=Dufourea novaeangliae TaxID=178035 RepID=A0A154PR46_DUFNO|nr:hypothetical protein WN55_07004 [Dufourea novaeangliae]
MNLVETTIRGDEMLWSLTDMTRDLGLLARGTVLAPRCNISMHIRPDISLTNHAVSDLTARVGGIMKGVEDSFAKARRNIRTNRFARNLTENWILLWPPQEALQFQRMIRSIANQLERSVRALQSCKLDEGEF